MKRSHNIGFIQGRLSPIINNKIQVFPVENWEKEFSEAKIIGLDMIEWTIDEETFVDKGVRISSSTSYRQKCRCIFQKKIEPTVFSINRFI